MKRCLVCGKFHVSGYSICLTCFMEHETEIKHRLDENERMIIDDVDVYAFINNTGRDVYGSAK